MKYTYSEYEINGIGDHNSVSSGPDNGANNCMAGRFWKSMRHGSTAQAVSNYLGRLKVFDGISDNFENFSQEDVVTFKGAGNLNIGGHGNEGLLETGVGQNGQFDLNKYILTWNQNVWEPELKKLRPKNFTMMSIYSCHSGAGEAGAQLLWMMANVLQRAVRGRTGFTYCGNKGITFESGSVWQVAVPGPTRPNPIPAPSPHLMNEDLTKIELVREGDLVSIEYSEVLAVEVQILNQKNVVSRTDSFEGAEAIELASLLFGSSPIMDSASVMGFVTAKFLLSFKSEKEPRQFQVYNDRLVEDTFAKVFYYGRPSLKAFLGSL